MKKLFLFLLYVCLPLIAHIANAQKEANQKKSISSPTSGLVENTFVEGMRLFIKSDYPEAIAVWEALLQKEKNDPAIYFYLAKAHLEVKNASSTLQYAKEANRLSPHSLDYGLFYADLLTADHKFSEAIECLVQLAQFDEGRFDVNIRLAQAYLFQEQYDLAQGALNKLNPAYDELSEIYRMKQLVFLKQNNFIQMIEEGEHLVMDNPEETLFSWEFFGILDFSKWPDAENQLRKLTEKYPEMGQSHLFLAKYYLEKNRLDLTFQSIANSLKDPLIEESMVKYMTMNAFSAIKQKQDVEGASALIDQVLKVFPSNAKFLSLKGNLLANLDELPAAQVFYVKSIRLDPDKMDIWQRLIEIDFQLERVDSVIVHVEEALTIFPNQGYLYFQLGFAQFMKSKNFQALASLETASAYVNSKDPWYPQLYSILGDNYHSMGRHKESDESFDKVLAVDPDDEHVLNNYSYYLSIRKVNLEKAAQMSKILVEKFPDNGTYLDTYAWVMFQKAEYNLAVKYLERAVLGDKMESSIVWEHYGDALSMANRTEDALKAWKKAKSLPGSSIILDKKIQMKQYSEN